MSLMMSGEDIELFDLKQGNSSMPKVSLVDLPNVAGQVFAGLHLLSVTKVLKSIMTDNKIPASVESKGLLVKRKDAMSLFTFKANISQVSLSSSTATAQDMYMLDGFNAASLCAGILKLFS